MTEFRAVQREAQPSRRPGPAQVGASERLSPAASAVLAMQRTIGNRATMSVLSRRTLQREAIEGGMWAASWTDEDGTHQGTMQVRPWRNLGGGNNNWIHLR